MRPIEDTNFIKLKGNNILFKKDDNSYIVYIKEYEEIITVDYWKYEDSFIVRKWDLKEKNFNKNGTYLIKQYQDWIYEQYFEKHKEDCLFEDLEQVIRHLNKFLYELY